jgi:hypothetical protein
MGETIIAIPKDLRLKETLEFVAKVDRLPTKQSYIFDFANMQHICPLGFLMVSGVLKSFSNSLLDGNKARARNYASHSYAAHMGFYKAFGLDYGKKPGEASGGLRYIPITMKEVVEIQKEAVQGGSPVGPVVQELSEDLAKVLLGNANSEFTKVFSYFLTEIIRNSAEHSNSKTVSVCAQYWPTQDKAEIAVVDMGDGIYSTLRKNPHLDIKSDAHALSLSLLPGISGKRFEGLPPSRDGEWENSGYGLYMTSRLCRQSGSFFIGSHEASIYLQGESKVNYPFSFGGTAIQMTFKPSTLKDFQSHLTKFSQEGTEIAKKHKGAIVTASSASLMVRSDYRR